MPVYWLKGPQMVLLLIFDGKFTLSNVPEKGIITITYIGYEGQDISIDWKKYIESNSG